MEVCPLLVSTLTSLTLRGELEIFSAPRQDEVMGPAALGICVLVEELTVGSGWTQAAAQWDW